MSIIAGILYRMGGSGNYPRQTRIIWTPLAIGCMLGILHFNWGLLFSIPLMMGAISSYWTIVSIHPPNKPKPDTEWWLNYYLHDFGVVLATLPYVIVSSFICKIIFIKNIIFILTYVNTFPWSRFFITLFIAPLIVATYSALETKAVREEIIRGFLISSTLVLLFI